MHEALGEHARADARFVEQRDHALFEDSRPDATEHVLAGVALADYVVDARALQELSEQEAGRPRADDGDLGAGVHATATRRCSVSGSRSSISLGPR